MNLNTQSQPLISVTFSGKKLEILNKNRKRPSHPDKWKDEQAKFRRNSGQPYKSRNGSFKSGKVGPSPGKICWDRCQFQGCATPHADKLRIFQAYYRMSSYDLQRTYLMALIEKVTTGGVDFYRYFIKLDGERHEICKASLMDIFQISIGMVKTLLTKITDGNMFVRDGRGRHDNHRTSPFQIKQDMIAHINSYPQYENHYSRAKLGDFYLSPDLSVKQMFRGFIQNNPHIHRVEHMGTLFSEMFKKSGLRIGKPKSDTCKDCDKINVKLLSARNPQDRLLVTEDRSFHLCNTNTGYEEMRSDIDTSKVDPNYVTLCGDLQQVLFSPNLTHSDMFYKRQFSTYNYGLYDGRTGQGTMTIWHESEGHRGSNEIISVLHRYLFSEFTPLPPGQERILNFWSDRCTGQTNNYMILCYFKYLIAKRYFTVINQKFMFTGHSFMPCDRQFAMIEKRKPAAKINVPDDWIEVIRSACVTQPFSIHRLQQSEIFDMKLLCNRVPKPNDLKVTEFQWFRMSNMEPHLIVGRNGFGLTPLAWKEFIIRAPNQTGRIINRALWTDNVLVNIVFLRAYHGILPITAEKRTDLTSMIPYLLPQYRNFYQNLV